MSILSAPGAVVGRSARLALRIRSGGRAVGPVATVVLVLVACWYLACIPMNAQQSVLLAERGGATVAPATAAERREMGGVALALRNPGAALAGAYGQDRPRLPALHQVAAELWDTTAGQEITSKRSLVYHGWVTLSATLLGFAIGTGLGILLAVGIVHSRVMDLSVMPWAIVSQTVPIIAIAPMIIVVLYSLGVQGIVPKAVISAYLSFFPVVVGMVKGLRSPDSMQLDLLRTYGASRAQDPRQAAPALLASLSVRLAEDRGRGEPRRRDRGRAADRRGRGVRRAAPRGQLLRPDRADLVRALRRRDPRRRARRARWADRAADAVADGARTVILLLAALALWGGAFTLNIRLAADENMSEARFAVPAIFGLTLVAVWELVVRGLDVPAVILPAPSEVARAFARNFDLLWSDMVQTFIRGALTGYAIGAAAAFAVALLADRSAFLRRGILPVGNFMAALPIVGTAPILVMWFGFDWQSKAAVVVLMVFFPILVNTVAGLADTSVMQRDLMRTYGAGYWPGLAKLRLPAALPFIFNGLKISTTLALIGAIVAEFFGSPTRGMGFRISTSVGQLALDLVWAEIVMAALAGSAFYGAVALLEKRMTFWHPSHR